jgi:hypothetical protein
MLAVLLIMRRAENGVCAYTRPVQVQQSDSDGDGVYLLSLIKI